MKLFGNMALGIAYGVIFPKGLVKKSFNMTGRLVGNIEVGCLVARKRGC